jgi:membrane fusion protein (multidrug efflux system)
VAAAQVLSAQAQVRVAEISLAYTDITAPIAGAIGRSTFTPGNVVAPNSDLLATIISQDPMRVAFTVSSRQATELRNRFESRGGAAAVQVRIRFSDGQVYGEAGRVDFIDTALNRETDTLLIRASLPNPVRAGVNTGLSGSRGLLDGQFVTVLLEGAEPVQAIAIPRAAVAQDQQGFFVFIVDAEGRAQRRNIRLGRSTPETAIVESGLNEGDRVISEGVQRVRPGQPVNAAPAGAPPRPTGVQGRPG